MFSLPKLILAGLVGVALLSSAPAANAQTAAASILVVDTVKIQDQSSAAKSMQTQMQEFEKKLQAQAKSAEEKLKAEEVGLKQQQTLLSPEQFDVKRREFETKVGDEQRKLQQEQQNMQAAVRDAQGTLFKALEPILKTLMTERGANMMVDRRMVLTSSDSLDVTATVIERLNKALPTVKVVVGSKK